MAGEVELRGKPEITAVTVHTIELSDELVERAKAITGKRSARAAVAAVIDGANSTPDARTRTFRTAHAKGETVRRGGKEAAAFMREFLGE